MVAGVVPAGVVGTEHFSSHQDGPGEREIKSVWEEWGLVIGSGSTRYLACRRSVTEHIGLRSLLI